MIIAKSDKLVTKKLDIVTKNVVKYLCEQGITVSTAESCTGGILSSAITSVAGASKIFGLGVCSYWESIKTSVLSVDEEIISQYGVVSARTASAMAQGVRKLGGADIGVGITGIAGPTGAEEGKPVGTVFVSVTGFGKEITRDLRLYEKLLELDREAVRIEAATQAMLMIAELVGYKPSEVI